MQTVTEFLIDYSSSMQGKRINACKRILLEEVLPTLDYSFKIGVKTFSADEQTPKIISIQDLKLTNKEELIETINKLGVPNGTTPIAAAIRLSVENLKEYRAAKKKIILITDGEENCGGDYEAEAKKAQAEGVDCEIHIIGLQLKEPAIQKAKNISNLSKGTFSSIPETVITNYSTVAVKNSLINFTTALSIKTKVTQSSNQPTVAVANSPTATIPKPPTVIPSGVPTNTFKQPVPQTNSNDEAKSVLLTKNPTQENSEVQPQVAEGSESDSNGTEANNDLNTKISEVDSVSISLEAIQSINKKLDQLNAEVLSLKENGVKINDEDSLKELITKENPEQEEKVRIQSEEVVFEFLKNIYSERLNWLNKDGEINEDHDFNIVDIDGSIEYYIVCKGNSHQNFSFSLTKKEWRLFLNHTNNFQMYFVQNTLTNPKIIKINNLLDWLLKGKIVPYSEESIRLKSDQVFLTILQLKLFKLQFTYRFGCINI